MSEKSPQIESPSIGSESVESAESQATSTIQTEVQNAAIESVEQATLIREINEAMSEKRTIWEPEVAEKIRQLSNPILVDFNNVLASNRPPIEPNPLAIPFLEKISKIGTVVVLTTARHEGRDKVLNIINEVSSNPEKIILVTTENYQPDFPSKEMKKFQDQAINDFLKTPIGQETLAETEPYRDDMTAEECLIDTLSSFPAAYKKVGPIFSNGTTEVPIIDDLYDATQNNPGLKGLYVDKWPIEPYPDYYTEEDIAEEEEYRMKKKNKYNQLTLEEAADEVIKHYSS